MSLSVNFKLTGAGNAFSLGVDPSLTILALKILLKASTSLEPEHMKLIFKGRILKDSDTLESSKVESGQTMHVVRSAGTAPNAGDVTTNASPSTTPAPSILQATSPETGNGALVSPPLSGTGSNPMAAMMQDPTMMQAAMQMMGGGGMATSPGVNGMGGASPMAAMMQDPAMMQAAMQMMSGGGGGIPQSVGAANPGLGAGGAGGADPLAAMMGGMDPAMVGQMMQNPMVQQMMQQMMQNPAMMQQMIQSNPMLQQMTQTNPMMAQMMSDPQLLQSAMQMMSNPQMMQTLGAMQGLPAQGDNVAMNQMMMQMLGGGAGGFGAPPAGGAPAATGPPEEQYAVQLEQLANMGFTDRPSNIQALVQTNGDVNQAINQLLGVGA